MDGGPELLDSGRPDEEGALSRFRRAHPKVVAAALVIASIAGAGWVAARALSGPDLTALSVAEVLVLDPDSPAQAQGDGGAGAVLGRVVRFRVEAPGLEPGAAPWQVAVLGLAGPGIVAADRRPGGLPLPLDPGGSIDRTRPVAVDCGAIELPVDPAKYGLSVAVGAGGSATGVLPLGRGGGPWARAVEADCATAEAARTARVVSVAGEVDPTRPIVDVSFLLENSGPYEVEVTPYANAPYDSSPYESADMGGSLDLAPGTRREVPVRIALDPCPSTGPGWGIEGDWSWPVGVNVAVAGILQDADPGLPLGLDTAASRTLRGLLGEACAGLPSLVIESPAEGVRYDSSTRVLEGAVVVTPPADWVGRLSVGPAPAQETGLTPEPLWQPSAFTGLGQTDAVTIPVRYLLTPGEALCSDAGLVVVVDVKVRVPSGAVERTARLQHFIEIRWPVGVDSGALCQS